MQYLSTAFLVTALVIVANQHGVTAQVGQNFDKQPDQVAQEARNRAVTIIDGPKLVTTPPAATNSTEQRPPSKPPISPTPEAKHKYVEMPRLYYGQIQNLPPLRQHYNKPLKIQQPNSVYKYHKVIPLQPIRGHFTQKQQQLVFAASTHKPTISKGPKFNIPVETINGIRSEFVRPPHFKNISTTTSTTVAPTTTRLLRTKRIWPKHILEKMHAKSSTAPSNTTDEDLSGSDSHRRYVYVNRTVSSTPEQSTPRGPYRPVTRIPKKKTTTPEPSNYTPFAPNDWVPIVPVFPINKVRKFKQTPMNRRSDVFFYHDPNEPGEQTAGSNKRMLYLQSYGLVPMGSSHNPVPSLGNRKNIIVINKRKPLKSHVSGYRKKPVHTSHVVRDAAYDASDPKYITRIKHHHHHHHHRYVKTVDKPVRVEVPKPYPVPVPMPVPVKVEHKVPYPVPVKVPHPVPVKVVEKEYVPKPYPVIQHVPTIKYVEVKVPQQVTVEKKVPVPYPVEKKVPYPVPVRVLVPQPYPVETKVPEPVEVIRHVRVPVPQPYPVKVPYPVEVEKKVPVPVPFKVTVPEKVEVEKKVPVYIPRPYPVEKKVPVRVPYPVKVPIRIPFGIPFLVHPSPQNGEQGQTVSEVTDDNGNSDPHHSHYAYSVHGNTVTSNTVTDVSSVTNHGTGVTNIPHHTVTVHGKPGFAGFQSRSDDHVDLDDDTTSTTASNSVTTFDTITSDPFASTFASADGSELKTLSEVTTPTLDPR